MNENTNITNQSGESKMPPMKLDVSVRPITPQKNLLGFAKVIINDCFMVENIKVLAGKNGLFINMPSMKDSYGKYQDMFKPITAEFREQLEKAVLGGYDKAFERMEETIKATTTVRNESPGKSSLVNEIKEKQNEIKNNSKGEKPAGKRQEAHIG